MEELLFSAPRERGVCEIYEPFYISENVMASDEKIISDILQRYSIRLVRRNRTLRVNGDESNIRTAIKDLIQSAEMVDLGQLEMQQDQKFNKYDADFVLKQIRDIEQNLHIVLPHPYNINLFSHIYILISRFRKAGLRSFNYGVNISKDELKKMDAEPNLKEMSAKIVKNIERYLNTTLPDYEVYFLFQYLISSRLQGKEEEKEIFPDTVQEITQFFIDQIAEKSGSRLSSRKLFTNLAHHIKPLLNRLEHGIRVRNNLLEQIKLEYAQSFLDVEKIAEAASRQFQLPKINEDEIGFITLYFAQVLEENPNKIKSLIMCTTGIGTSELLKVKIGKKIPDIEILDVISTRNIHSVLVKFPNVDLIISTVKLDASIEVPSIVISAMLTVDDQERLLTRVEELRDGK
jgi:activator of the mannose operon (transcriptional antiterminator)